VPFYINLLGPTVRAPDTLSLRHCRTGTYVQMAGKPFYFVLWCKRLLGIKNLPDRIIEAYF